MIKEKLAFYIILGVSCITSIAFEMQGVYSMFGISVYLFLTLLIASSKLFLSFYNKSRQVIFILSMVTTLFASLEVITHYLEASKDTSIKKDTLTLAENQLKLNQKQQESLIKREDSLNKTLSYGYSPKSISSISQDTTTSLTSLRQEEKELTQKIFQLKEKTSFNPFLSFMTLVFIFSNEFILAYLLIINKKTTSGTPTPLASQPNPYQYLDELTQKDKPHANPVVIDISKFSQVTLKYCIEKGFIFSKNGHIYSTIFPSIVTLSKENGNT